MTRPFLALITPLGEGGEHPANPIAPGGPPPRPWGPINYPDQGLPGPQPGQPPRPWGPINYPDQGLPRPPPIIWGGGGVGDYIDAGFPGPQPGQPPRPWGPINPPVAGWGPGFPTNPIVLPPYQPGGPPVTIWPNPGNPSHPIVLPPLPAPPPDGEAIKPPPETGGWAYAPSVGWGYFPGPDAATPKG